MTPAAHRTFTVTAFKETAVKSHVPMRSPRITSVACAAFAALLLLALGCASASAAQTHVFIETFGSAAEPTFSGASSAVVDQASGDILVIESASDRISRYHSDGTPSNFSALGSNFIDGAGPGADETPQGALGFDNFANLFSEVAVDNSCALHNPPLSGPACEAFDPAAGDIYVTQNEGDAATAIHAIDIFASSGEYLGQISGAGASSFHQSLSPCGVTVDPVGNLYVGSESEEQIYKYEPTANPPVNGDHVASFSSVSSPCQLAAGAGPTAGSLFATSYLAGTVSKLNSFSGALDYTFFPDSNPGKSSDPGNNKATQLSVSSGTGHVFFTTLGNSSEGIVEFDASESPAVRVANFGGQNASLGVAADPISGRVYAIAGSKIDVYSPLVPLPEPVTGAASNIERTTTTLNGTVDAQGQELSECKFEYGLTSSYEGSVPCAESNAAIGTGVANVHADLSGLTQETVYHYRLTAKNVNGSAAPQGQDRTFQTKSEPEILGLWAQDVGLREATLKAQINPQSAATTYRFEWGLTEAPYEHATADVAIGTDPTPHTVSLFLQQLSPKTVYHYRLVAENELGNTEAADHTFTTFGTTGPETDCPNQSLRYGASASLPDCRAYEMVSPVDKNGADIVRGLGGIGPGGWVQASVDGNKLTYGVLLGTFAGQQASFRFNQYISSRDTGTGWATEGIHPPARGHIISALGLATVLSGEFFGFSPDLCSAWLFNSETPPPTADGQVGFGNLYRRQNCGSTTGQLETLTASPPSVMKDQENFVRSDSIAAISAEAPYHALFRAAAPLTPDAAPFEGFPHYQIYDRFDGANHLVSIKPNGTPEGAGSTVGSYDGSSNVEGAVSADGSRVYWTSEVATDAKPEGTIYLRLHPEQGKVDNECATPSQACTLQVSGGEGFFWQGANDGSRALYSQGERLFVFDLAKAEAEEPPRRQIAEHVLGVAGASQDLSRVYFVSTDVLPGSAQNSEGMQATEGEPNLYLAEDQSFSFVATLGDGDVNRDAVSGVPYNVVDKPPIYRATRVTPNGARIVFESRQPLTGYDNDDPVTGVPALEVFSYGLGGELTCISCNPSGSRPSGTAELRVPFMPVFEFTEARTDVSAASWIPTWEHPGYASHVMSGDGSRIFFNSYDALLPLDANGVQDVYEWEASGSGSCTVDSAGYSSRNGGCIYLISSGEGAAESEFWEASSDGSNVFFTTASSLLAQDPGSVDLYDARVDGGFPQPVSAAACEGEACQSPPRGPDDTTPASSAFRGAGNVEQAAHKKRCPKRWLRKRSRCVKKHHGKNYHHHPHTDRAANRNRKAAR